MIQRVQSIWLLLATLCAAVTFKLPFYTGTKPDAANVAVFTPLNATSTIWLTILTVLAGIVAFVTIFLFDNRKLQLKLVYLGIFLTLVLLTMYFLEMGHYTTGSVALWSIFYVAILPLYILAARGIWKDEKLVKSMDRLR